MALCLFAFMQTVNAQKLDEVVWFNYSKPVEKLVTKEGAEPIRVLIFNRSAAIGNDAGTRPGLGRTKAFLTNGGGYGMQGVLSDFGTRFYITKSKDYDSDKDVYNIHSYLTNKVVVGLGNCLSYSWSIYMDRGDRKSDRGDRSYPNWRFEKTDTENSGNSDNCGYYLKNMETFDGMTQPYLYYKNHTTSTGNDINTVQVTADGSLKDEWCFITEEDYRKAMTGFSSNFYIEASGLIHDASFNRFNDYQTEWKPSLAKDGYTVFPMKKPLGVGQTLPEGKAPIDYYGYIIPATTYNLPLNETYLKAHTEDETYEAMKNLLTYKTHVMGASQMDRDVTVAVEASTSDDMTLPGDSYLFMEKYGKDYCAGIYADGKYEQTIKGVPAGTYRITCTAVNTGTNEFNGSLLVNGHKVNLPLLAEKDGEFQEIKKEVIDDAIARRALHIDDYYYQGLDVLAASRLLEKNKERFTVNYYITVEKGADITIGFSNNNNDDMDALNHPVFADNFRMYLMQMDFQAYISANNVTDTNLDKFDYKQPVDLYVRRAFTEGWNPIVLPYDITLGGAQSGIGEGVNLSKLIGINPDDPKEVLFEFTNQLKAGECGLIYIPKKNGTTSSSEKALKILNAPFNLGANEAAHTVDKTIHGPYYCINGALRSGDENGYYYTGDADIEVNKTYVTGDNNEYKLHFHGYYYKPDNKAWPAGSYVMENGTMYQLQSDWGKVYGTMWYLTEPENALQSAPKVFNINGVVDGDVTSISGVGVESETYSNKVYNLNGQYVGTAADIDRLPKGMYIINGKKVVVK